MSDRFDEAAADFLIERARQSWEHTALNIMKLHTAGVRIGIGSDGGGQGGDRFIGFTAHTELENMVAAGMTPAEAIVAGTKNGAEILGLEKDLGMVTVGQSADFIVLNANPLDEMTNSRKIDRVYLRGPRLIARGSGRCGPCNDELVRRAVLSGYPAAGRPTR